MFVSQANLTTPLAFLRLLSALVFAGLTGCTSYTWPCQSTVQSNTYASKTGYKVMVAGGDRCYWNWSQPSGSIASRNALKNCQKQHNDCRVVAVNNTYIGKPKSQTESISASDVAVLGGLAAAAGGVVLGVNAARKGRSIPTPTYTPSSSTGTGMCPKGWWVDPLYPSACTCGKTMTLGPAHAHQHARTHGPCRLPR